MTNIKMAVIGPSGGSGIAARIFSEDQAGWQEGNWPMIEHLGVAFRNGQTCYRIARCLDDAQEIWTWIGRYAQAAVSWDERGGYYYGVGFAFKGTRDYNDCIRFVSELFKSLKAILAVDGSIKRPISDFDPSDFFRKAPLSVYRPVHLGLDPRSSQGFMTYASSLKVPFLSSLLEGQEVSQFSVCYLSISEERGSEGFFVEPIRIAGGKPPGPTDGRIEERPAAPAILPSVVQSNKKAGKDAPSNKSYETDVLTRLSIIDEKLNMVLKGASDNPKGKLFSNVSGGGREEKKTFILYALVIILLLALIVQMIMRIRPAYDQEYVAPPENAAAQPVQESPAGPAEEIPPVLVESSPEQGGSSENIGQIRLKFDKPILGQLSVTLVRQGNDYSETIVDGMRVQMSDRNKVLTAKPPQSLEPGRYVLEWRQDEGGMYSGALHFTVL